MGRDINPATINVVLKYMVISDLEYSVSFKKKLDSKNPRDIPIIKLADIIEVAIILLVYKNQTTLVFVIAPWMNVIATAIIAYPAIT